MTLQPGQTVGRYQILEPLGVGGMATVYKAFQPSLEREVALKVLRPGFAEDAEFFQRFQREARSIARLRHPNIVQVFDFEPVDGRYILAMEFLEGGTLKERVTSLAAKGERLSHSEVARIVGEVASALGYGHELGIIHRDVKPSNDMRAARDRAVVTDFGIAKIMGGEGQTQTGVGIGTPEYMAPEQGGGAKVDHRADIYSLGVMTYEMLTGRVPFAADTPLAVVLAHMRDPLPLPTSLDPSIPAAAEQVLLKALAKDPNDRHASATDFAEALRAALTPAPPTAATIYPIPPLPQGPAVAGADKATATPPVPPQPATRGVQRPALVGAAMLVVVLIAGAALALPRQELPPASPSPTAPIAGTCQVSPCPSPGGPGPAGPGAVASGPAVALPTKGALMTRADLRSTANVFGASAENTARAGTDGLSLEAREGPGIGVHAPPPPPGAYGDLITEVRAAPLSAGLAQYRIMLGVGASQDKGTFVSVSLRPGNRVLVAIVRDDRTTGGPRILAASRDVTIAGAHTLLILRKGDQIAAFVNGQFAVSATDPLPQRGGVDLYLEVIYAGPGSTQSAGPNSVRVEEWAFYAAN